MSVRLSILVFSSYALLSLIFTYPLVVNLTTHVPGEVEGDVPVYIWNLWWMKHSLLEWHSPLFSDFVFAPYGVSLAFHAFVFLKAFIAVPLQALMSAWMAYNLLILFTFAMAGYAMFLLARHLTGDEGAAWVAGLVYAFSPYMLTRSLGHLNYLSGEWMPLYILCLMRLVETPQRRWALAGSVFLLLTAYCEYYYLIYLTIFTGGYLGWIFWCDRGKLLRVDFLRHFALMGILVLCGFAPILWILLGTAQSDYLYGGWGATAKLGADLLAFITPPPGSLLYGDVGADLYGVFSGGNVVEGTVFSGFLVLGLTAFCVIRLRHIENIKFWLWSTFTFFLFSLGPLLHIGGDFVFALGPVRFALPLPYIILRYIPLIKGARVPARFDIMVALGLAVLVGFALWHLRSRWRRADSWTLCVALLVCLEYGRSPYPTAKVEVPSAYEDIALDERDVVVLDVPLGWRTGWGDTGRSLDRQQLYQIEHGKRLIGGFASRIPEEQLRQVSALPGIGQLLALQEELPMAASPTAVRRDAIRAQLIELLDHLPSFVKVRALNDVSVVNFIEGTSTEREITQQAVRTGALMDLVDKVNLGYVILHPPYSEHTSIRRYIETGLPLQKYYERDGVIGYKVINKK